MPDPFQATRRGMLGALSSASVFGIGDSRAASYFRRTAGGTPGDGSVQGGTGAVARTVTEALSAASSSRQADQNVPLDFDRAIGAMGRGGPIEVTSDLKLPGERLFGPARGNIHAHDYAVIGNAPITRNDMLAGGADGWALTNFSAASPGLTHPAGSRATATQPVDIRPFTLYLITLSAKTTTPGRIRFRLGKTEIPSSDEAFTLGTGDGTFHFLAFSSDQTGRVSLDLTVDSMWGGLIQEISVAQVEREFPYDIFSIPNDRIDFANPMGIKFGRFMSGNIAIGDRSTSSVLSQKSAWNIAIGNRALSSAIDNIENTAVGSFSLEYNQADQNTAGGYSALRFNTKGARNTGWGYKALFRNGIGSDNTGVGYWSGFYCETGSNNTNLGSKSGYYNRAGSFNAALGAQAGLQNDGGSSNTYVGAIAGPYTSQPQKFSYDRTTCLGAESKGYGSNTIAIGYQARCGSDPHVNGKAITTTALAIGYCAAAESDGAIAVGGGAIANGAGGIAIGEGAGRNLTGAQTVSIGAGSNSFARPATFNNAIAIGYGAKNTNSNQIALGNSSVTEIRAAVSSLTAISDRRDKKNIVAIDGRWASHFVKSLKPSRWDWQMRDDPTREGGDLGFIAQDVLAAQLEHDAMYLDIVSQNNPERLEMTPGKIIPLLVSALQNALTRIEDLENDRTSKYQEKTDSAEN